MKKQKKERRHAFSDKRFFAKCWNHRCGRRFETDNAVAIGFTCPFCKTPLTWNDAVRLESVTPERKRKLMEA